MTQFDYGTINPTTKSGTQLASDLNSFRDALHSSHKGGTAPTYATAAMIWVDDTTDPTWVLKVYDGADWIAILTLDTTANTYSLGSVIDGTTRASVANIGQIQDGAFTYLGISTGANTIVAAATPAITAYAVGVVYTFRAGGSNTGVCTLNINGVGALAVQKKAQPLVAGDIAANDMVAVLYNGTNFQMISPAILAGLSLGEGVEANSGSLRVKLDGSSIGRSSNGLKVADNGVGLDQLAHLTGDTVLGMDATGVPSAFTLGGGLNIAAGVLNSSVSPTVQSLAGKTEQDFAVAAGATKITLGVFDFSTNGTNRSIVQLGVGTPQVTGYKGDTQALGLTGSIFSTGFVLVQSHVAAGLYSGLITLELIDPATFTWCCSINVSRSDVPLAFYGGGHVVLTGVVDIVRLTTEGGVNTMDGGYANIRQR